MLGTGYVGLVTGACFSEFGYDVICVDKDKEKINNLENGILPVIIGGGHDITYALYKAYSTLDRSMTLTTVDKKFDLGLKDETISNQNFFSKILEAKPNNLFHYSNFSWY